jgi:P-type Cu2+ transporter
MTDTVVACFHCGEPCPNPVVLTAQIDQQSQPMCCFGCQAIATGIMNAGLTSYYRLRTEPATPTTLSAQRVVDPKSYDDQRLQIDFVHHTASGYETTLNLEGMTCSACAWLIESSLQALSGVMTCSVHEATQRLYVTWNPTALRLSDIITRVSRIGYQASPCPLQHDQQEQQQRVRTDQLLWRLGFAGLATMQVMMFALALYSGYFTSMDATIERYLQLISLLLCTPVAFYCAQPFYISALRALSMRRVNMDVPVSLAILMAYTASCVALWQQQQVVYFESITMFTFFLLLGRWLEGQAQQFAATQISKLRQLIPTMVYVKQPQGFQWQSVKLLQLNDTICVGVGERIQADGVVISGASTVEESMLTGESTPITKRQGDAVYCGTINIEQPLYVRVTAIGTQQVIAMMLHLQEKACLSKPNMALLAEKVARYFVPSVLIIAACTYGIWSILDPSRAFLAMLSVLIATCPCALALATPTAMTCAMAWLQQRGVVLRNPTVFETLTQLDDVIFDKTGTLTQGQFSITSIQCAAGYSPLQVGQWAHALEQGSHHPLASAFSAYADHNHRVAKHHVRLSQGVEGYIEGIFYQLGSSTWLNQPKSTVNTLYLMRNQQLAAVFTLQDQLRDGVKPTLRYLENAGLKLHLLSGDSEAQVHELAKTLNVSHQRSQQTPVGKLAYLQHLQHLQRKVAVVGDGMNDSPMLAAADVAIAMGSGMALNHTTADIILTHNAIAELPTLHHVARITQRIIRQNLAWALLYNLSVLPLAVAGWLPPYVAALGMSLSSLLVTINGLRILRFKGV